MDDGAVEIKPSDHRQYGIHTHERTSKLVLIKIEIANENTIILPYVIVVVVVVVVVTAAAAVGVVLRLFIICVSHIFYIFSQIHW